MNTGKHSSILKNSKIREPEPLQISYSQTRTLRFAHTILTDHIFLFRKPNIPVLKGYYITHFLQWSIVFVCLSSVQF